MTTNEDYERGYTNGENSGYADWYGALMDVLPPHVDASSPAAVAAYIRDLLLDREEQRT